MIDKNKPYKAWNGMEVRIYATDGEGSRPVHGALKLSNGVWSPHSWYSTGENGQSSPLYPSPPLRSYRDTP